MKNHIIAFISKNRKLLLQGGFAATFIVLFTLIWIIQDSPDEINFINIADQIAKLKLIKLIGWGVSGLIVLLGVIRLFQRISTLDKQLEKNKSINSFTAFIKSRKFLLWGIVASIIILSIGFIAIIWVIGLPSNAPIFTDFVGQAKIELIKLIGLGVSGLIAILGVIGLFQRGSALDRQNEISEQNYLQRADEIKESQIHERFKVATEHLGNKQDSVRIAAFYEFYHLAETEKDWRRSIFYILCAHLRYTTKHEDYNKERTKEIKPTEEVQILLTMLFTQRDDNERIFNGLVPRLEETNLQGATLSYAYLQKAYLNNANLQETYLHNANLQDANLSYAYLQKAYLNNANLQETYLYNANLQDATLQKANLQGADLQWANLQGATLQKANLQEANLLGAYLQGANLQGAYLQEANLQWVTINKKTIMPPNWETMVKKDDNGETGVIEED